MPNVPPSFRQTSFIFAAFVLALILAVALDYYYRRENPVPQNRPIQSPSAGYVTSNTCRSCHPGNYASWHSSYHRTMTQVATPSALLADVRGLELTFNNQQYKVERRGDNFFVRKRPQGGGDYGKPQQVVLLTGSHTLQILWVETAEGRTLTQFPFAYIIAEKIWAPVTQTFLMPPETQEAYSIGAWNGACMDCHVTQGLSRFVEGNRWDTQVAEFGIACEACHSEGSEHVALNRNPIRRWKLHLAKAADSSVANAARMKGPESALVCGQCHSVWAFDDMENKIEWNRHGGKFRPGKNDLLQRFVVQPNGEDHREQKDFIKRTEPDFFGNRFWADGMIRVTGREFNGVQASPCFRGGEFSCISCHEMHHDAPNQAGLKLWARNGQLKPGMDSDQACLQCHKDMSARLVAHTHHTAESSGSRCYNCHMPNTTFGLLHAMRSHQVSSPTAQESVAVGRPNACNLCHLNKTLAWTSQKLTEWYKQKPPELSSDDQTISAAVQWIIKGDAGQRALIAWGMGWEPAQKTSRLDWLYPYLIYSMADSYAAVRFDAWKSLQTLPGFSNYRFNYTAADEPLNDAVSETYQKWWQEVRLPGAVFKSETGLDQNGRFEQDIFHRLRTERNEKPIVLAE